MKTKALQLLLLTFLASCAHAQPGNTLKCVANEPGQVQNKTKLLKTYTREYWQIANHEILGLPPALRKKGFVIGDFHFNNIGLYYDFSVSRAQIQINDFDDAGKNSLIIDLFKFLTFVHKTDKEINQDRMLAAYIQGLQKIRVSPPAEIAALADRNQLAFTKDYLKYIENTREEFDQFDKSTLTPSQLAMIQQLRQLKLIRQLSNLDYISAVNDSGSSMNSQRFSFMGTDASGAVGVIEFKGLKCSATGDEREQNLIEGFDTIKAFFNSHFPGTAVAQQTIYRYDNQNYFLVREKKKNALKKLNFETLPTPRLQVMAEYYANFLGLLHQPSSDAEYINAVNANPALVIETARNVGKIFKNKVKE